MDTIVLKADDFLAVAGARGHTTYEQQATATGISVGTLHRLRSGGPAGPSAIARICSTYGVAFEDVFTFGTAVPKRVPAQRRGRRVKARAA
jgi:hypothetical protein